MTHSPKTISGRVGLTPGFSNIGSCLPESDTREVEGGFVCYCSLQIGENEKYHSSIAVAEFPQTLLFLLAATRQKECTAWPCFLEGHVVCARDFVGDHLASYCSSVIPYSCDGQECWAGRGRLAS